MAIQIDGQSRTIGLALSGGGFRAAAFHLGVLHKLHDLNLLDKIDTLSCVSGGSIIGGFFALNHQSPTVLDEIETYLTTKSIAVGAVLGGIFSPFESRLEKLSESYDRDLFKGSKFSALENGPRIYLNTTNLATGNLFSFVAGGKKEAEMGDYELGFVEAPDFKIADAVAASSAFPPVFPPLKLDSSQYPKGVDVEYITLSDGGIYDNMGVGPLLNKLVSADYVIVSDGGKPFKNDERPTESGSIVLVKSIDIMMEQIRGLEFRRLEYGYLSKKTGKPIWFSIDSTDGQIQESDAAFASTIETNLKALSQSEMTVLKRHGGALVEARLKKYSPELIPTS